MKNINCGGERAEQSLVLQYCVEGRIIRYLVPRFNGIEVRVKDCYTDKVWKEHGSDKSNYEYQMAEACRMIYSIAQTDSEIRKEFSDVDLNRLKNGLTPVGYTVHHAYNIGKDLIAVLAKTDEHKQINHRGASYFANKRNLLKDVNDEVITKYQKVFNEISHVMHKNPNETSIIIGTGAAAVTFFVTKGVLKNTCTRVFISILAGFLCSFVSNYYFSKDTVKYC